MGDPRFDTVAVVLGMHRSGTSALAGVLALTGFTAPRTLLPSSAVNERGFWESEPIKALNDELFAEQRTSWHSLEAIPLGGLSKQRLRSVTNRTETILSEEFERGSSPLVKDPRLSRLLPFWRPALERLSARTVYAITVRSPLEVARSLAQRNDLEPDLGYLLWARYYLDAEFHTRGLPRAWIAYDRLIENWRDSLAAFSSEVNLDRDIKEPAAGQVDEFLSAELRHHRTADEQALIELERFPYIQDTYRVLLDWARGRSADDKDISIFDRSRDQFDRLSSAVSRIAENARLDRKRVANAKAQTDAVAGELTQARRALEDLEGLRVSQTRLEARIDSAVASLDQAIQQRLNIERQLSDTLLEAARERSGLQRMLAEAQSAAKIEHSEFKQKLSDAATANDALRKQNEELRAAEKQAAQAFEQKLAEAACEQSELQRMLAEAEEAADRVRAALEQKLSDAVVANDALRSAQDAASQDRLTLEQRLSDATAANRALTKEIDRLRASHKQVIEDFESKVGALQSAHDTIEVELKDVKRKYRSTQHQLTRDREKLRRTQEQLARTEAALATIEGSAVWRSFTGFQRAVRIARGTIGRILGNNDRRRRGEHLAMLRESSLFDAGWYVRRYADVAAARIDPAVHYLDNGWREGRDPGPSFSTSAYLRSNNDVARAGTNPLLHFIEFGYSEGRNVGEVRASVTTEAGETVEQFEPAAPCVTFEVRERTPVRWCRAARLSPARGGLLEIGREAIGFVSDPIHDSHVRDAFSRLASLSGYGGSARQRGEDKAPDTEQPSKLRDVWFVSNGRLRCRWKIDDDPIVVRAYQHDPRAEGELRLIGEGLIVSALDFIDANLKNPYFPVLFVLCEPGGGLRHNELLAFPSLARCGLHYPELVALEDRQLGRETGPFDVIARSDWLAAHLSGIVEGRSAPFLGKLAINLAGADGTEPLFQPDFHAWLRHVAQIGLEPLETGRAGSTNAFLTEKARSALHRRKSGSTMILPADAIPSIEVLVMAAGSETSAEELAVSIAVADADPAQPTVLIEVPPVSPSVLAAGTSDYITAWPRFENLSRGPAKPLQLLAIRHPRRPVIKESELLLPVAEPALQLDGPDQAITWLIFPEDWDSDALRHSLEALAIQQGAHSPTVSLVGVVADSVAAMAARLFTDRLSVSHDLNNALESVRTPLLGYLGAHVILHDGRTSKVLSALLKESTIVSASCVLVSSERRGKGWHVSVADAGKFGGENSQPALQEPLHFWRSTYPILRPPRDLWMGRAESVKRWLQRAGPLRPEEGVQLCTSVITASYVATKLDLPAHLSPPASAEQRAIRSEVLFG